MGCAASGLAEGGGGAVNPLTQGGPFQMHSAASKACGSVKIHRKPYAQNISSDMTGAD